MKDHFELDYRTLAELRYYAHRHVRNADGMLDDILGLVRAGSYPENTEHLTNAIVKHQQAVSDIAYLKKADMIDSLHLSILDPQNESMPWIITFEMLCELKEAIEKGSPKPLQDFLDALFYKDYLQSTRYTLQKDPYVYERMQEVHENYIVHLEKCIQTRRLRMITHYK